MLVELLAFLKMFSRCRWLRPDESSDMGNDKFYACASNVYNSKFSPPHFAFRDRQPVHGILFCQLSRLLPGRTISSTWPPLLPKEQLSLSPSQQLQTSRLPSHFTLRIRHSAHMFGDLFEPRPVRMGYVQGCERLLLKRWWDSREDVMDGNGK
ncbi:hypothetical protein BU25DRAFT_200353 [Macroventuria anomochaeta]|uniref:Uncharacterized protein n=1 Tax=Macroventuria anomochaeta TaxID=301207 RepID=A0ACB6RM49_9PLEO|nr:uncharacterized protein BU25DRAFT_200353 [Macroventuria anomochaeta]KAF2623030.1 hypothetical protein BU25DRAFT_200353 [Macroventuria anomochaeta]